MAVIGEEASGVAVKFQQLSLIADVLSGISLRPACYVASKLWSTMILTSACCGKRLMLYLVASLKLVCLPILIVAQSLLRV